MTTNVDEPLWQPDPASVEASMMTAFRRWLRVERGLEFAGYRDLWRWSVTDLEAFWAAVAEFFDIHFHDQPRRVLADDVMPGAEWFPGATVNYAEHALRVTDGKQDHDLAVLFAREDGRSVELTFGELRAAVASMRAALAELGVRQGDRVAAFAPNCPETLVAFLATASLGAIWSSCSPDFGARAVTDRFVQIEPKVLFAVDGYQYGGRSFDVRPTVETLRGKLPGLAATVLINYVSSGDLPSTVRWEDLSERHRGAQLVFDPVPFSHPLWVLYSSGTTGLPKGIVHSQGGILVEHLKALGLHCDLGPGDRFFWFTTTGWMMWNFLVGGLLVGATVVMFDGNPAYPSMTALWELVERYRIKYFGTSAPYIHACLKENLHPKDSFDLSALRVVGSTGSPLSSEGFQWVAQSVGSTVQVASVSGGTDLCTAFVGCSPDLPVWRGELSCALLGAAAAAFDDAGRELRDEVGELVLTRPTPSMPVFFWNDPDGSRLHEAYFNVFPGVWRHGDWVRVTHRDTFVIYGRSDSTLNRGGVRMGTAEFYRVVEGFAEIADSLVIDTSGPGRTDGELLCFLVLVPGVELGDIEPKLRRALRDQLSPRHVPNRFLVIDAVPQTLNGKKLEVPVKKILSGASPEQAVSKDALRDPAALAPFVRFGQELMG